MILLLPHSYSFSYLLINFPYICNFFLFVISLFFNRLIDLYRGRSQSLYYFFEHLLLIEFHLPFSQCNWLFPLLKRNLHYSFVSHTLHKDILFNPMPFLLHVGLRLRDLVHCSLFDNFFELFKNKIGFLTGVPSGYKMP